MRPRARQGAPERLPTGGCTRPRCGHRFDAGSGSTRNLRKRCHRRRGRTLSDDVLPIRTDERSPRNQLVSSGRGRPLTGVTLTDADAIERRHGTFRHCQFHSAPTRDLVLAKGRLGRWSRADDRTCTESEVPHPPGGPMTSLDIVIPARNEDARASIARCTRIAPASPKPTSASTSPSTAASTAPRTSSAAHAVEDEHVVLHMFPKLGKGGVLMETFRRCDGELIGFVDADCATPPAELARLAVWPGHPVMASSAAGGCRPRSLRARDSGDGNSASRADSPGVCDVCSTCRMPTRSVERRCSTATSWSRWSH